MKLLFLGTGHGVPTVDRFFSATLLECGGQYYLIDAGAPIAELFVRYGISYEKLRAVLFDPSAFRSHIRFAAFGKHVHMVLQKQ